MTVDNTQAIIDSVSESGSDAVEDWRRIVANEMETVALGSSENVPPTAQIQIGIVEESEEVQPGEVAGNVEGGGDDGPDLESAPDLDETAERSEQAQQDAADESERVSLFSKHADELNRLSIAGLGSAMEDLGLLSNRSEKESNDVVVATFATLDVDKKNYLSPEEFETLYEKAKMPTLVDVLREEHPALVERLEQAFVTWATFGKGKGNMKEARSMMMGTPSFIKLLRDAHVAQSVEDVHHFDVVFAKVKERGASKISFAQFVDALGLVSEGSHCELDLMALATRICDAAPSVNSAQSPRKTGDGRFEGATLDSATKSPEKRAIHINVEAVSSHDSLLTVFESYARFGIGRRDASTWHNATSANSLRLSSQQFAKLARESKLISRAVTAQKLDVIFASCKSSKTSRDRTRGLTFDEFVTSLSRIAKEEGVMPEYIINKVRCRMEAGPMINSPALTSSPASFVRLHDDDSARCGVYGRRARRWSDF